MCESKTEVILSRYRKSFNISTYSVCIRILGSCDQLLQCESDSEELARLNDILKVKRLIVRNCLVWMTYWKWNDVLKVKWCCTWDAASDHGSSIINYSAYSLFSRLQPFKLSFFFFFTLSKILCSAFPRNNWMIPENSWKN